MLAAMKLIKFSEQANQVNLDQPDITQDDGDYVEHEDQVLEAGNKHVTLDPKEAEPLIDIA